MLVKIVKQIATSLSGGDNHSDGMDNRCLAITAKGTIYLVISLCFVVHLSSVIYEYSTFKYVDTTRLKGIDAYFPDIAICRRRKFEIYPLDLHAYQLIFTEMNGHFGNNDKGIPDYIKKKTQKWSRSKIMEQNESKTSRQGRSSKKLVSKEKILNFEDMKRRLKRLLLRKLGRYHFLKYQHLFNLTASDAELVPNLQDILIKCQSMGHPCSAEDFTLPNQLDSTSRKCIIFKTRRFMEKIKSFNESTEEHDGEELLSVLMKWKWNGVKQKNKNTRIVVPSYDIPIDILLLHPGVAPIFMTPKRGSGTLLTKSLTRSGHWLDIIFDMKVKNSLFCNSQSQKEIQVLDRLNKQPLNFAYTPLLCGRKVNQQKTLKHCGCISAQLPMLDNSSTVNECISIPASFHQASSAVIPRLTGSIYLYDSSNNSLGTFDQNSTFVFPARCAMPMVTAGFSEISECPELCQEVSASVDTIHNETLAMDTIESHFSDDDRISDLSNYDLRQLFGFQVQPSSWQIPVTSREEVYPLSKLLSDVGGLVGLWLDVSAVTVMKVLLMLYRHQKDGRLLKKCQNMLKEGQASEALTETSIYSPQE